MFAAKALAAFILIAPLGAQTLVIQPAKAEKTTETRTVPLASGSTLKVENVNGFIRVEAWDREEVQFTGEFKPSSKDEQVKVTFTPSDKKLVIKGEYPKHTGWGSYRGPSCEMTLKVPRKVMPNLESVNGEVTLTGISGNASVETVNGAIKVKDLNEALKAHTVNGSISLDQVKGGLKLETVNGSIKGTGLDGSNKGIEAETVNGSIHLQISGIKGHLKASTVNGDVSFKAKGADDVVIKKHKVSATFPGGDQQISLETVNGGIVIE
ncbi:MAG: DUF4097 family beta strand repeat-containing protein [Holophaga sp.]